jgi:nucleotide-binding universal stress UspA family protein
VYLLGEAYAFGVIWSFVFQAFSMLVLRFRDPRPREYKVPFNVRVRGVEVPVGLGLIFLVLVATAVVNLLTKEVATVGGLAFSSAFIAVFLVSERYHQQRQGAAHEHVEQFNRQIADDLSPETLGLRRGYRKLVAIRSPQNLYMLEKALAEADPGTTDVVVMTAKPVVAAEERGRAEELDRYDQQLMTAVVQRAERAGKRVRPLIVPTNNPLYAVIRTAKDLQAQELIVGASNQYSADDQLEQIAFYWINMHHGQPAPLTVRILGRDRDMYLDLAGGTAEAGPYDHPGRRAGPGRRHCPSGAGGGVRRDRPRPAGRPAGGCGVGVAGVDQPDPARGALPGVPDGAADRSA